MFAAGRGAVVALARQDGRKLWQLPLTHDRYSTGLGIAEGLLFFSADRGPLYAVELATGRPRGAFEPGSGFSQPPVVQQGVAWIISNAGSLFTLGLLP